MKLIGYIMITVGFLAGSLSAVISEEHVKWGYFLGSLLIGSIGIVLVRIGTHHENKEQGKLASNIQSIEAGLSRIVKNITQLNSEKQSINTYDVRFRIDELFLEDLAAFVEARQSIAHIYGLAAYGEVMSSFAAGERYLNRVWSASADGYIDEVNTYIEKAREQFVDSLDKIRALKINQTNPALSG
jgi:hypothetical protein